MPIPCDLDDGRGVPGGGGGRWKREGLGDVGWHDLGGSPGDRGLSERERDLDRTPVSPAAATRHQRLELPL